MNTFHLRILAADQGRCPFRSRAQFRCIQARYAVTDPLPCRDSWHLPLAHGDALAWADPVTTSSTGSSAGTRARAANTTRTITRTSTTTTRPGQRLTQALLHLGRFIGGGHDGGGCGVLTWESLLQVLRRVNGLRSIDKLIRLLQSSAHLGSPHTRHAQHQQGASHQRHRTAPHHGPHPIPHRMRGYRADAGASRPENPTPEQDKRTRKNQSTEEQSHQHPHGRREP